MVRHTSTDQLDDVSGLDDGVRVPGLFGGSDYHGAFQEVEFELNSKFHEFLFDNALTLLDVLFSILGKQDGEAALLKEGLNFFGFDLFYFPVVDIVSIPWFILTVLFGFGHLYVLCLLHC